MLPSEFAPYNVKSAQIIHTCTCTCMRFLFNTIVLYWKLDMHAPGIVKNKQKIYTIYFAACQSGARKQSKRIKIFCDMQENRKPVRVILPSDTSDVWRSRHAQSKKNTQVRNQGWHVDYFEWATTWSCTGKFRFHILQKNNSIETKDCCRGSKTRSLSVRGLIVRHKLPSRKSIHEVLKWSN